MIDKEEDFIRQINLKKVVAFRMLFNEFYGALVVFAMRFVEQQEVAEDIVQDLFTAMWERDARYSSYPGLKTFLYNSVRNNCLDYLKHRNVEKKYIDSLTFGEYATDELDDKIMKEELYRMLVMAIHDLPYRCREIFEMHMQGKRNEEIARMLGLSIMTVKTQKKRAVQYLKRRLGDAYMIFF